jgi:hypothetical protein
MNTNNDDNTPQPGEESVTAVLAGLVHETERMLELASAGEWEEVAALEAARSPRLTGFFDSLDQDAREQHGDVLRRAIERILDLDSKIVSLGEASKAEAMESYQHNQSARKAAATYQENKKL